MRNNTTKKKKKKQQQHQRRVLLISSGSNCSTTTAADAGLTGNGVTACRIRTHLQSSTHPNIVDILHPSSLARNLPCGPQERSRFLAARYDVLFGIHLFKVANSLLDHDELIGAGGGCAASSSSSSTASDHTTTTPTPTPPLYSPPLVLIIGGTDINEDVHIPHRLHAMTAILCRAHHVVCFSDLLLQKCLLHFLPFVPGLREKLVCIPPSCILCNGKDNGSNSGIDPATSDVVSGAVAPVDVVNGSSSVTVFHPPQPPQSSLSSPLLELVKQGCKQCASGSPPNIFVLAGGLRPVKDQLFVIDKFSEWRLREPDLNLHLLLVGPILDTVYGNEVMRKIETLSGVHYHPFIAQNFLHQFLRSDEVVAICNTSLSEGLSNVMLEALCLGVAILGRNIESNASLLHNGKYGILFDSAEEFVTKARSLVVDPQSRSRLIDRAKEFAEVEYSVTTERNLYVSVYVSVLSGVENLSNS